MSKTKQLLVSLAVVAAATAGMGLYAYVGVYQKEQREQEAKEREERRLSLAPDDLVRLTLRGKGETTVAEKRGDGWLITAPVQAPADEERMQALLREIGAAKRAKVVADDKDFAPFGLDAPEVWVEVEAADGATNRLEIGTRSPFDQSLYVSVAPGVVLSAPPSLETTFDLGSFDLRDKRLLVFGEEGVTAVEIHGTERFRLESVGADWVVAEPFRGSADQQEAEKLLQALRGLRATAFPQRELPTSSPVLTATVTSAGGDPLTLQLWRQDDVVLAQVGGGPLAQVDEGVVERLDREAESMRDRRIAPFPTHQVARMEVAAGEDRFTLAREGEGWRITSPKEAAALRWKVQAALSNLSGAKHDRILPSSAAASRGLVPPARTISLFDEAGSSLASFSLGDEREGAVHVQVAGKDDVFRVSASELLNVPKSIGEVEEQQEAQD
jgi:hypothetical protein